MELFTKPRRLSCLNEFDNRGVMEISGGFGGSLNTFVEYIIESRQCIVIDSGRKLVNRTSIFLKSENENTSLTWGYGVDRFWELDARVLCSTADNGFRKTRGVDVLTGMHRQSLVSHITDGWQKCE